MNGRTTSPHAGTYVAAPFDTMSRHEEPEMHNERAKADASQLQLPQDLLVELQRRGISGRHDFKVENWQPSFFERIIGKLTGRK